MSGGQSKPSIEEKLWGSVSVRSLIAERDVAAECERAGWAAVHGCSYMDLVTGKAREVDVVARRDWLVSGDVKRVVQVKIVAEVKSLPKAHIVIVPDRDPYRASPTRAMWLGLESETVDKLRQVLHPRFRFSGSVQHVEEALQGLLFPDGQRRVEGALIAPPQPVHHASSFRETTVDNEVESDRSVLWNAARETWSAVASMMRAFTEHRLGDIEADVEELWGKRKILLLEAPERIAHHLSHVSLFLPVVVLDSHLWIAGERGMEALQSFRLQLVDDEGRARTWCDVVRNDHLPQYVQAVTEHFKTKIREAGRGDA